ncbi:MAG TPA: hypothetical protein VK983_02945 [Candidatus Limnocylindrales bacterium]|nr:hypothetical protein [Candidatus Limnocylindrales bacterium]
MNGVPIYTPEDLADFEEVGLDPYEDLQSYGAAISAEAPFAFGIDSRTHNVTGDAAALTMFKVDTRFGSEIESSSLAVGLVGEIGDEEPNNFVFTSSDIAFVLQCLKAQRNVCLTYVSFEQDDQVEWVYGL